MNTTTLAPVTVSPEAHKALAEKMREWSGWPTARLEFGNPGSVSSIGRTSHDTKTFTINVDRLLLNPNRVLLSVVPFRLRQEAVLTGVLLHEAGHARYTHWKPRTAEARETMLHGDLEPVTDAVLGFANIMEEPRIERLVARDSAQMGAAGLAWTMRASATRLLPLTSVREKADEQTMDLLVSWALRAGREIGYRREAGGRLPFWIQSYNQLLGKHLEARGLSLSECMTVQDLLYTMILCDDHKGPTMVDLARDLLALVFPETDAPMPAPETVCATQAQEQEQEQEQGQEQGQEQEQGEGEGEGESESEGESEGDGEAALEEALRETALEKALREIESEAQDRVNEATEEEKTSPPSEEPGTGIGFGEDGEFGSTQDWRSPSRDERLIQQGAERFLRDLVDPSETSKVVLSESPSATVDGAALAAWKAGGQVRDPMFFRRTKREVAEAPPVKIAILVDVSASMDVLQKPSALLSWALAAAALAPRDLAGGGAAGAFALRNFAGRGQQIESTTIHWGTKAAVIQEKGVIVPGIHEAPCNHWGTFAMAEAMDLIETQIPGFFDASDKPSNRLLVQFTDWELSRRAIPGTGERIAKALASGVNMLSVVPNVFRESATSLPEVLRYAQFQRGRTLTLNYDPQRPGEVWEEAARALTF